MPPLLQTEHTGTQRCCAECRRTYQREYQRQRRLQREDVREQERAASRDRYWADPEKGKEIAKRWRESHPEQAHAINQRRDPESRKSGNRAYYAAHAEQMRERARTRRKTHPEDKRRAQSKRKAMRSMTACTLSARDIEIIKSRGCLFCGSQEQLTLAHDVPVSRGGATTAENCFCLCSPCNSRMGTRTLAEYGWRGNR